MSLLLYHLSMVAYLFLSGQTTATIGVDLWCVVGSSDNVLRPLFVGKNTEMPDILVMLATFGGITIFGTTGILIGPIVGALFMTTWKLYTSTFNQITDKGC